MATNDDFLVTYVSPDATKCYSHELMKIIAVKEFFPALFFKNLRTKRLKNYFKFSIN